MNENPDLRKAILDFLERRGTEASLNELLGELRGYDDLEIRSAIWPLLSEHEIEITPARNVRLVRQVAHQACA